MKRLLVIDDSDFDRDLISRMLGKNGYVITARSSGQDVLKVLSEDSFDLVLLDGVMPEISGTETLSLIRSRFNEIELPVIMVTASRDSQNTVNYLRAGANDHLLKPINFQICITRIEAQLKLTRLTRQLESAKQLDSILSMIATYNHEINNPLAIALGKIELLRQSQTPKELAKLESAIGRISSTVEKIQKILTEREFEKTNYVNQTSMIKLK